MGLVQDPMRQIGYLQQCLSNDKKPLAFFIGAGCPMAVRLADGSPLIPDTAGLTAAIRSKLTEDQVCLGLLEKIDGHFKEDGRDDENIESMLSHIRALSVVVGKGEVRGLTAKNLETLDDKICDIVQVLVDKELPFPDTPYRHVAKWIDATRRGKPVELFTTNYDLLMEQALEE